MEKNEAEGIVWLRRSAGQNQAWGQYYLGLAYLNGVGVPKDGKEGAELTRKAAEQGLAPAQAAMAQLLLAGRDVPRDDAAAAKYARRAADQGNADGFNHVLLGGEHLGCPNLVEEG